MYPYSLSVNIDPTFYEIVFFIFCANTIFISELDSGRKTLQIEYEISLNKYFNVIFMIRFSPKLLFNRILKLFNSAGVKYSFT